jgi:hypothetical protein
MIAKWDRISMDRTGQDRKGNQQPTRTRAFRSWLLLPRAHFLQFLLVETRGKRDITSHHITSTMREERRKKKEERRKKKEERRKKKEERRKKKEERRERDKTNKGRKLQVVQVGYLDKEGFRVQGSGFRVQGSRIGEGRE